MPRNRQHCSEITSRLKALDREPEDERFDSPTLPQRARKDGAPSTVVRQGCATPNCGNPQWGRGLGHPAVSLARLGQGIFSADISCANSAVLRRFANTGSCIRRLLSSNPSSRALRRNSMARSCIPACAKSSARQ